MPTTFLVRTLITLVLLSTCLRTGVVAQRNEVADLLEKSREYEDRLVILRQTLEQKHRQVFEKCETYRELYRQGLLARIKLEAQEEELARVEEQLLQEERQLRQSRELRREILASAASQDVAREDLVERFAGGRAWGLEDLPALSIYYQNRFGEALPISALGQTPIHTQFGFDHRRSADLAIHPDSDAGKAVLLYLRLQKIPFIAFRAELRGVATGAHIHVGPPSDRLGERD